MQLHFCSSLLTRPSIKRKLHRGKTETGKAWSDFERCLVGIQMVAISVRNVFIMAMAHLCQEIPEEDTKTTVNVIVHVWVKVLLVYLCVRTSLCKMTSLIKEDNNLYSILIYTMYSWLKRLLSQSHLTFVFVHSILCNGSHVFLLQFAIFPPYLYVSVHFPFVV